VAVDEHGLREAFYKAKTINVYFDRPFAGLGIDKLPFEKNPRILHLYLPVPPRPGIPEHILRQALSCRPPPIPSNKFAAALLVATTLSGVLSLVENPYSEIAWFIFVSGLIILVQIAVARIRRGSRCPRRVAFVPEEYKQLVEEAARIINACKVTGQCTGEVVIGARRLAYATWKPNQFTRLVGLDRQVVFVDPSSARRRGGGWGGRR